MADGKKARGKPDRSKVSQSEGYEVAYFAKKYGISAEQTRGLIDKIGNSRVNLTAATKKLKAKVGKKAAKKKAAKKKAAKR